MIPLLLFVTIPTWLAILWRKYLRNRPPIRRSRTVHSIVLFRLDQLGDLVLTTPLFRELKRHYPLARITAVIQPQYKAILTTNRHLDEILTLKVQPGKWPSKRAQMLASALWYYWTELRRREFDLAISPRFDVDEDLATMLCALTHARKKVGHSTRGSAAKLKFNWGFDAAYDTVIPTTPLRHEVDRNLEVITALGGEAQSRRLEICLSENDRRFAAELLEHHDQRRLLVALGIGGRAPGRRWPLRRYAECINVLNLQHRIQPVIVCSEEEDAEASALSVKLPAPPYILSGVPLRTVCAVLERCDLFLGNDTGTAHLAAAMDCPTIVISRHAASSDPAHPNSPARFAPLCAQYRVLQPQAAAAGCTTSCRSIAAHCILGVTVEHVIEAANEVLPFRAQERPNLSHFVGFPAHASEAATDGFACD
jgi:heptosyltransferase-2